MRHIPYTLLILAATAGFASAQATSYSIPVGYVTENLVADQFNLIGLTMHATPVAQGVLDAYDADSVTDSQVNFGTLLTSGKTYILEITSGSGLGAIQEISSWAGSDLTTPDDISSIVDNTTTYALREARQLADVFGATNSAGLTPSDEFNPDEADLILLPKPDGTFRSVYYSTFPDVPELQGWFDTDGGPAADALLSYVDGFFVQRRAGSLIELVVNGEVKTTPTTLAIPNPNFNYYGGVYPVGVTLGNSGISSGLTPTDEFNTDEADLVLLPKPDGTYISCYYSTFPDVPELQGWFDTDGGPAGTNALTSGFMIQRRGGASNVTITPPVEYSSL